MKKKLVWPCFNTELNPFKSKGCQFWSCAQQQPPASQHCYFATRSVGGGLRGRSFSSTSTHLTKWFTLWALPQENIVISMQWLDSTASVLTHLYDQIFAPCLNQKKVLSVNTEYIITTVWQIIMPDYWAVQRNYVIKMGKSTRLQLLLCSCAVWNI